LLLLIQRSTTIRAAAATGFSFGLGLFLAGVSWVYVSLHDYGGMAMPVAAVFTLLFCLYLACYPAIVGVFVARFRAPAPVSMLLLFPALWALSEWMRGWLLSGFPWLATGYSQAPHSPLAGYAPVLGVFGLSLATAMVAGALSWMVHGRMHRATLPARTSLLGGGAIAVAMLLLGFGLSKVNWTEPVGNEPTTVALLQGNIPQEMKWRPERAMATLDTYLQMAGSMQATLIVLPETALPMLNVDVPPGYLEALSAQARKRNGDVLVGVPELDASGHYYNSVMSYGSAPTQVYRKHHLVPFGDYFPLRPVLGWVMKILHIPMSDFSHGEAVQKPILVAGQKVAVNICYEDAFGEEIIRQLPEATVLANFTNDAWWGDSIASQQHLQIAQMRALETGRAMLRATNTGVTAIIDPKGRIAASAPEFTTTAVSGEFRGYRGATPYVRWGNYGFIVLSVLMILIAALVRLSKHHPRQGPW
jgi:apolipoprotein N-acyltransferase